LSENWVAASIPEASAGRALADADRSRVSAALETDITEIDERTVRFAQQAWELALVDALLEQDEDEVRLAAENAFQLLRVLVRPAGGVDRGRFFVRLGCLGLLADRQADAARLLTDDSLPQETAVDAQWGDRTEAETWEAWLRLIRKRGWEDLDRTTALVADLRQAQVEFEEGYLDVEAEEARPRAWGLVATYHLAHAAEILAEFCGEGAVGGRFDVTAQLDAQFDRAGRACERGELVELDTLVRLLRAAAARLVQNSIWTVTRAVNSRVTDFVHSVVERGRRRPLFDVLPPQRIALRDRGLLGSNVRSVVVSLPTSSGKTLIAEFRILQALNQFDREKGWVAYLAPTRALVNQVARRLRRDFAPLDVSVEKVNPALEVDGLEASLLTDDDDETKFRVLVTTPEKLDLLIRGDWEEKIGRPLTLVVVDEAHNLQSGTRGLRLELLLATINRECRFAQFLLLTPFLTEPETLARWLAPDSHEDIRLSVEWIPNDRSILLSRVTAAEGRGAFSVDLEAIHTSHRTLSPEGRFDLHAGRPLGLSWSDVNGAPGKIAAATAQLLADRGPSIILAQRPDHAWGIAKTLVEGQSAPLDTGPEVELVRDFLTQELGPDFPLVSYIDRGVGVHHSGLSDDARALMEWLFEREHLDFLVATTTIAQGVNFPVASVILASYQYPYGMDMPPQDFWNVAGRTGRIGQGDLGIVALAAKDDDRAEVLRAFVNRQVAALDSTLVQMVLTARGAIADGDLSRLSYTPEWSSFLQYLAHSYRQIGDPNIFATEVEQVLRGALGYQQLQEREPDLARGLIGAAGAYAEALAGKPLGLVDATGFSWESVNATLGRLGEAGLGADAWDTRTLFANPAGDLRQLMGVILQVPELRANLEFALGGVSVSGRVLAEVTSDWVQGRPLPEIAQTYFSKEGADAATAMTDCCKVIFGKLAPTVSWGLSAMQSLTLGDELAEMPDADARAIRNLPSRVFYGVDSDEAIALRLLGVPRLAAVPLAQEVESVQRGDSIGRVRLDLAELDESKWREALGDSGGLYRSVWKILEGEDVAG
jgi:DEAD/DEAH box helicase/Helicase conserved C-terminal domain